MDGEWIIPFAGRKESDLYNQNFLWRNEVVYIMDNHRAALWCWLRHLKRGKKYDLIHVDRHSDAMYSQMSSWINKLADLDNLAIQEYLKRKYLVDAATEIPVICCGNYLSIFLKLYSAKIEHLYFATAGEGDEPLWDRTSHVDCFQLLGCLKSRLASGNNIVNFDLDYFFARKSGVAIFSDTFVQEIFKVVRKGIARKSVSVLTIALSPEWCGGWEHAEALLSIISDTLGLDFALKKTKHLKISV